MTKQSKKLTPVVRDPRREAIRKALSGMDRRDIRDVMTGCAVCVSDVMPLAGKAVMGRG